MQFKEGTDVYTVDGDKAGSIDRVVIDPRTSKVSHLVVRKGLIFTTDKVVPIDMVKTAEPDKVVLQETDSELSDLPDFEEVNYVAIEDEEKATGPGGTVRPVYYYPPGGTTWWGLGMPPYVGYPGMVLDSVAQVERNIPESSVPLKEGARVISADEEQIGDVERIFTDSETDRATHILISQGLFLKERKLVPTLWIETVGEEGIWLGVDADFIDRLPEYEA